MNGLSLNRLQRLPQTISPEGWQRLEQDPEVIQYGLEASQIRTDLRESYRSAAAAVRSCDHRVPDLLVATARLKSSRRVLLKYIYDEECRKAFAKYCHPQIATPSTPGTTIDYDSESKPILVDDAVMGDACDWMVQLEQEEECALELNDYETIVAEEKEQSNEVEIVSLNPSLMVTDDIMEMHHNSPTSFPLRSLEGSNIVRLHKINDGSARPKNMTITRVGEAMSSGGPTDADLSDVMVEIFSATHRTGRYIPGEEPLLGTSICHFSGADLSLDSHSPETAHSAHAAVVRRAAEEAFEKHLLPLDVPCTYYS